MSDRQISLINQKFQNMSIHRKEVLFQTQKRQNQERIHRQAKREEVFSPKINSRSSKMVSTERSKTPRYDQLYQQYQAQQTQRQSLQDLQKQRELQALTFTPNINKKTNELARNSAKNFNIRTMEHYNEKHRREDKSTEEIEY